VNTKLSQIAEIKTGVFAKPEMSGAVVYLQSRHFDESGNLSSVVKADLRVDSLTTKHLLKSGDLLFAAKGSRNFATVYRSDFAAVASTTFFVLRVRDSVVLPEYLSWLLNSPATKKVLKGEAIGSSIVSISKVALGNLKMDVPSFDTQRKILEISRLSKAEYELRLKIAELRRLQVQQAISKSIK